MIASCYQCEDPLIGKYAESFRFNTSDTSKGAKGPSWNTQGVIIWNDWKPITGEQAWAVFIGPLQYLYLKTNGSIPLFKDHKTAPAEIQLAISILPAIKAMTSAPGSMYHIPKGGDMYPEDKEEAENVSNENNFSMSVPAHTPHQRAPQYYDHDVAASRICRHNAIRTAVTAPQSSRDGAVLLPAAATAADSTMHSSLFSLLFGGTA